MLTKPVPYDLCVAFNQEKALVGAFSVITNLRMDFFEALVHSDIASCYAYCQHGLQL